MSQNDRNEVQNAKNNLKIFLSILNARLNIDLQSGFKPSSGFTKICSCEIDDKSCILLHQKDFKIVSDEWHMEDVRCFEELRIIIILHIIYSLHLRL